ncbi:Mate efflux family protein [Seminavis robusta]|uniref:Mate efflux family protein n=1 Tax=Seminavis robusta TaxID=568900 RepID=A0A9N8HQ16_9STRA|nr:Mate efflux family protein [Seminavis robusta]|eukprot:Sro1149_g246550.1 Mate efflux family protein (772) ;mRNA; f:8834-12016
MEGEEDEGFVGYVPSTVDPGPIVLMAVLAIGFFVLVTLPFAVILGDKFEELEDRINDNVTDSEEPESKNEMMEEQPIQNRDPDESSVSSKQSAYSAISSVMKEVLDNAGRPRITGGGLRHKHRHRARVERKRQSKSQYSTEFEINALWDDTSQQVVKTVVNAKGEYEIAIAESDGGSYLDAPPIGKEYSDCGPAISDCGKSEVGIDCKVALEGYEKPLNERNVCLSASGFLDELARIMTWDIETRRIFKLSIPFVTQAIFTGALDVLTVGVIGKLVGTQEVSAWVTVNLLIQLTTKFVGGFHESLATLCSQAIGNNKPRLAGKYVQIAAVLYLFTYIPFAIMWVFVLDDTIRWFGFDETTIRIGTDYGYLILIDYFVDGFSESIHALLDVAGFESYSTAIGAAEELIAFIVILLWALLGNPTLFMIGVVQFGMGGLFLSLNIFIIWWKGWFKPYRSGMVGTFALKDRKAVWLVFRTAMPLSFGYLLTDGEWEILTFFASYLGPAEVVAWGIFGTIWDSVTLLVDSLADASEIRCAFLLGSGQPDRARLSAYKSITICIFAGLFLTSGLFICGEDLPRWMTNDPTLQHLLRDLLPMFGLGNLAMTVGTMSWTLLGSQGRYRLATVVVLVVSWLVTLPLAAVFSIHLKLNLEAQTATVVIGYMLSAAIHSYYLFRSDWVALSESVMDDNGSRASDDEAMDGETNEEGASDAGRNRESNNESVEVLPDRGILLGPLHGRGDSFFTQQQGTTIKGEWKDSSSAQDIEVELELQAS